MRQMTGNEVGLSTADAAAGAGMNIVPMVGASQRRAHGEHD